MSATGCAACEAITGFIESVHAEGGVIKGAGWTVLSIEVLSSASAAMVVDARVDVAPQQVRESAASKWRRFPGGTRLKTFWLTRDGHGWRVDRLDQPQ
jgi:hypothetical protein